METTNCVNTSMKKKWKVKCPRCKKHWILKMDLKVAPKYKYCSKCSGYADSATVPYNSGSHRRKSKSLE